MTSLFDKVQTAKHLKEREDLINLKDNWLDFSSLFCYYILKEK